MPYDFRTGIFCPAPLGNGRRSAPSRRSLRHDRPPPTGPWWRGRRGGRPGARSRRPRPERKGATLRTKPETLRPLSAATRATRTGRQRQIRKGPVTLFRATVAPSRAWRDSRFRVDRATRRSRPPDWLVPETDIEAAGKALMAFSPARRAFSPSSGKMASRPRPRPGDAFETTGENSYSRQLERPIAAAAGTAG